MGLPNGYDSDKVYVGGTANAVYVVFDETMTMRFSDDVFANFKDILELANAYAHDLSNSHEIVFLGIDPEMALSFQEPGVVYVEYVE